MEVRGKAPPAAALKRILQRFRKRLRITDEIGEWGGHLAVLLTDTPGDGACIVATRLCELALEEGVEYYPRVFVYPDDASSVFADENSQDARSAGGQDPDWVSQVDRSLPGQGDSPNSGQMLACSQWQSGETRQDDRHPASEQLRSIARIEAEPMAFMSPAPLGKRLFDFCGAACGLILLSPLMLAAAIWIKCSSPGPIVFMQYREGHGGRRFRMYKFRTMVDGAESQKRELLALNEQDGPAFKIEHDPRLTRCGRILRKTCIDELPQLINVLRGEMSLVGPRPLPVDESLACSRWHRRRLDVLPGMTCIWQVRGGHLIPFDEWMRMDLEYVDRHSFRLDLELLVATVQVAVLQRGSA